MKSQTKKQAREVYLLRKYGITSQQYEVLLQRQNKKCAICEKPHTEAKKLHVDHDHVSGQVRGLLCYYCNRRLVGRHRDGALLRRIADYIEQGTGWFVPKRQNRKRKNRK